MKKIKNFVLKKIEDLEFTDLALILFLIILALFLVDFIIGATSEFTYSETPIKFSLTEEGESLKSFDLSSSNVVHSNGTFEKDGKEYKRQICSHDGICESLGFKMRDSEEIVFVSSPEEQGIDVYVGEKDVFSTLKWWKVKSTKVIIKVFISQ